MTEGQYGCGEGKLTWEETYRAMAAAEEGWSDFESTVADGLYCPTPATAPTHADGPPSPRDATY